jgi:tRNA U34 5-carboxymethylaminomethyl modifying GTPase MnmE/TrmE
LYNHDNISLSTNISDLDFTQNISKLDIFMNYRTSYNGETSLSTLEAMRQGVAVIVRDIGWYGELPDDVVIKVSSEEEAIDELDKIINDPVRRNIISNNAKVYIQSRHDHKQYVKSIKDLISQPVHGLNHEIAVLLKNKQIKNAKQYLNIINKLWKKNNA